MSVRSKAGSAALLAVAPEAELAEGAAAAGGRAAAGKSAARKAARRHTAADPRVTRPGSTAARQRQAIEDIKASRPADDQVDDDGDGDAGPGRMRRAAAWTKDKATDQTGSPGWWPSNPDPVKASNAGGGFLLAVIGWAFIRAYLHGGATEMSQLWRAKFFNQTEGGT